MESRVHGYVSCEVTRARMETRFMAVDRLQKYAPATVLPASRWRTGGQGGQAG